MSHVRSEVQVKVAAGHVPCPKRDMCEYSHASPGNVACWMTSAALSGGAGRAQEYTCQDSCAVLMHAAWLWVPYMWLIMLWSSACMHGMLATAALPGLGFHWAKPLCSK
eukprot:jgi/Ulvmu1/12638/UM093_0031.1